MTRREKLERRLDKRREWAEKAEGRSAGLFEAATDAVAGIEPGQPILVGHHSERHHRRALDRHDSRMRRACETADLARHHDQRADGLERQLDRSIFSDDPDAIGQLQAKIEHLEQKRAGMKALNAHWRKHGTMRGAPGLTDEAAAQLDADIPTRYTWERQPVPGYRLTNLGAEIRRAKERIKDVGTRTARTERAEASGGYVVEGERWVSVTFAEKPSRTVLDALRGAGFYWNGGAWNGERARLPLALLNEEFLTDA